MDYNLALTKWDYSKIDKLNNLTNKETFWDDVRKLTKRVASSYTIHRWECLAEARWKELNLVLKKEFMTMDKNYIKFIIAYDYGRIFEGMELACDEAFELAEEIANRYIKYTEEEEIDQHYETLCEFCNDISFSNIWEEIAPKLF